MKILFLTDDFPPKTFGGAGIVAFNLAKGLKKKGHDIFVITTVRKKSGEGNIKFKGLYVFRIYANYHQRWQAYLSLYNLQTVSKVKKLIKEMKPDIVHAHNIHYYLSYCCLKIAKQYAKAVFLTTHDAMLVHYGKLMPKNRKDVYKVSIWDQIKEARKRYNPFRNRIIRYYLKYVDKILTVSDALKKLLMINGIKNIETIYNGIDVNSWKVSLKDVKKFKEKYNLQNKKVILFGGRLSGAKGGDQILRALALIKKEIDNAVLLVVGERNKYAEKMKDLAEQLGIVKNVIFTGLLSGSELKSAYHSADISIFPSLCFETFGMINLEAMACKKPVVSSYFGGPKEVVINGKTGYLINPHKTDLMAEKIIELLKNPEKAKKFGEAGYQRAKEKFSLDKQIKKTLKCYRKYV